MTSELRARLEANLEAARVALEAAQAEPWVLGSTGQLKAHPGFVVAARCDAIATKLAVRVPPGREVRALTHGELVGLLVEVLEEWRLFFEFLAHTGLRIRRPSA